MMNLVFFENFNTDFNNRLKNAYAECYDLLNQLDSE